MENTLASLVPAGLMNRSGKVFYSGRAAFTGRRPLYVLGLNPGGDPDDAAEQTVEAATKKVTTELPANWSAYRDESWKGNRPGTHGMQPRMLHMFRRVGMDPGEVPASNVIFLRSRREATLADDPKRLAEECWPFHQKVIDSLGVGVVLCLGKPAGKVVLDRLGKGREAGQFVEMNDRKWPSTAYETRSGIRVVVVTHPSIVDWTSRQADPTGLVVDALKQ